MAVTIIEPQSLNKDAFLVEQFILSLYFLFLNDFTQNTKIVSLAKIEYHLQRTLTNLTTYGPFDKIAAIQFRLTIESSSLFRNSLVLRGSGEG